MDPAEFRPSPLSRLPESSAHFRGEHEGATTRARRHGHHAVAGRLADGYFCAQPPWSFWYHHPLAALPIQVLAKVVRTSFSHSGWPLARAISL